MKYEDLAIKVIELIGGGNNVDTVSHCATRLRFTVVAEDAVKIDEIRNLDGVMALVNSGGQIQVVVGQHVAKVYEAVKNKLNKDKVASHNETSDEVKKKHSIKVTSYILDMISGAFSPLIPALCGSGLLKALLAVFVMLEWLTETSPTYKILLAASNSIFYFLPIFLSITLGMKLQVNPYIAGAIGAALLDPGFTSLIGASGNIDFLGISVVPLDYAYNVFPVFVSIFLFSKLEVLLRRLVPQDLQLSMVPLFSLVIMVPLTVLFFGPFSTEAGRFVASGVVKIIDFNGVISGAFLGATYQFIVTLGLHWGLAPLQIENVRAGGDPVGAIGEGVSVFALMGIAIGVWIRSRQSKQLHALSGSAAITAMLAGVTEPILYGILFRYKRLIPVYMISGAVGGAINGFFGVKMTALVFHSLFSIPVEKPTHLFIIGAFTALLLGAILTVVIGYEKKK